MNLLQFLNHPYPFYYRGKDLWIVNGVLFLMTVLFGYLFEPFHVYVPEHKMNYFWINVIHGFTPMVILSAFSWIFLPGEKEETWTIGREVLLIVIFLFLIGTGQFLIRDVIYDNPNNWSWRYLYEEIRNTFLVGGLFASILIPVNFSRLQTKNARQAMQLNNPPDKRSKSTAIQPNSILIKINDLELDLNYFIFAKAEGNYVSIHFENEIRHNRLERITIKELETLTRPNPQIIKTHRSYLLNIRYVAEVSGNAQGYRVSIKNDSEVIPVSRKSIPAFDENIQKLMN